MAALTDTQIALYMIIAGFPAKPKVLAEGIGVVHAESGGDPKSNPAGNEHIGLWAESPTFGTEAERLDAYHSTVAARKQWEASGKSFYPAWGRWELEQAGTDGSKQWREHTAGANKAVHVVKRAKLTKRKKGTHFVSFGPQDLLPGGLGLSILEEFGIHLPPGLNPSGALQGAQEEAIKGATPQAGNVGEAIGNLGELTTLASNISKLLFTPEGWLQIGEIGSGIILIGWGIHQIIGSATGVNPARVATKSVTKTAVKAAEVAAIVK